MARFLRSIGETKYRGPVVVLARPPVVPPLIVSLTGLLTNQRRAQQRRTSYSLPGPIVVIVPPPVLQPVSINTATGLLTNQRRAQQRRTTYLIGEPAPPILPTQRQQTVTVALTAQNRRLTERSRFPLQGWSGDLTSVSSASDGGSLVLPLRKPMLGPWPPQVAKPLPTQRQQTIRVAFAAAQSRRNTEQRRFPWQTSREDVVFIDGTGLIDNFNRSTLGPSWSGPIIAGDTVPVISSNTLAASGAVSDAYWNVSSFAGDMQCEATLAVDGGSGSVFLWARIQATGNQVTGYQLQINTGTGGWTLIRRVNGSPTTIGSSNKTVAAGDKFRLRCVGNIVTGLYLPSGSQQWSRIVEAADSTISGSGYLGLEVGTGNTLDDFTGGAYTEMTLVWRQIGPHPPILVSPGTFPPLQTQIDVTTFSIRRRLRPLPKSLLFPPATLANPPPATTILVKLITLARAARPRTSFSHFAGPVVTNTPPPVVLPVAVYLATGLLTNQRRAQQRRTAYALFGPIVVTIPPPVLKPVTVAIVQIRPKYVRSLLPVVIGAASGFIAPPISVTLVRTRPRRTIARLKPPFFYSQTSEITVTLTRTRPRQTRRSLTAVSYPATSAIRVALTRTRPRHTFGTRLGYTIYLQTSTVEVTTVRTRPRHTISKLVPLIFYRQTSRIAIAVTRIRPRHTIWKIAPPATLEPEAVELAEQTIRVQVVRTRPRHTIAELPIVIVTPSTFVAKPVAITLVRIRPRPTTKSFRGLIFYPATSKIAVALSRIRPEPTRRILTAVTYPATSDISITLVRTRPRPTTRFFSEPTVVRVPSVEQAEDTIRVTPTRTRPRPTAKALSEPTVLQTFSGPSVSLTHTRPRPTTKFLGEPTVIRVPSVEQREDTILVSFVRTRPRPTVKEIFPPTKVRVPSVEQREQTITVNLTRTRPRHTISALAGPTVVQRQPQRPIQIYSVAVSTRFDYKRRFPLQGWRQRLIRETGSAAGIGLQGFDPFLGPRPPQIVNPLPTQQQQTLIVSLEAVRTGVEQKRHFPLPGFEGQLVRETGYTAASPTTNTSFIQTLWKPNLGVKPPTIIGPLASQQITTKLVAVRTRVEAQRRAARSKLPLVVFRAPVVTELSVTTVAVRTRVEQQRHFARFALGAPTVVTKFAFFGPEVTLTKTRPRPTTKAVFEPTILLVPSVETRLRTITVALVHTRPRPTTKFVGKPAALRVFAGPAVTLVHTRPRHTVGTKLTHTVYPATSEIQVSVVRTRPRPTRHILTAVTYSATSQIRVTPTRTRPRPTTRHLSTPTTLATFSGPRTHLVATRPRPTAKRVFPPTRIITPPTLDQQKTRTALARIRPRPTTKFIAPPAVITPPPRIAILVISTALTAVQNALWPTRRKPHLRLRPPTAVKIRQDYFTCGPPRIWWETGSITVDELGAGEDLEAGAPIIGWAAGLVTVNNAAPIPLAVTIIGTAKVGELLTANVSGVFVDILTNDPGEDWEAKEPLL